MDVIWASSMELVYIGLRARPGGTVRGRSPIIRGLRQKDSCFLTLIDLHGVHCQSASESLQFVKPTFLLLALGGSGLNDLNDKGGIVVCPISSLDCQID